jgi:hypothetical protein
MNMAGEETVHEAGLVGNHKPEDKADDSGG